jgi:hypothetical protein
LEAALAEIERLRADKDVIRSQERNAAYERDIAALEAEIERLRAALEPFANMAVIALRTPGDCAFGTMPVEIVHLIRAKAGMEAHGNLHNKRDEARAENERRWRDD